MNDIVLVDRLREAYWPPWLSRWASAQALRAEPRGYEAHDWRCRRSYDLGRVHFLVLEILAGKRMRPIELDTRWAGWSPVGLTMLDGHHRLAASVLAGKKTIPASFSGPLTLRDWLLGERQEYPL